MVLKWIETCLFLSWLWFYKRENTFVLHLCVCVCVCVTRKARLSGACVHWWHVWHTLRRVVFTLVKRSEVNGGRISRWLKKRLAVVIDDAITVWIKLKSVSPLALRPKSYTSCCELVSPSSFPPMCHLPFWWDSCNHQRGFGSDWSVYVTNF